MSAECKHETQTVSAMMEYPRLGVTGTVICADCGEQVGTCKWVETSKLVFELIFERGTKGEV